MGQDVFLTEYITFLDITKLESQLIFAQEMQSNN